MRRITILGLLLVCSLPAAAGLCARPGSDGVTRAQGVINLYVAAPQGESLQAGAREVPLGETRGEGELAPGDLVWLVQVQGARIQSANAPEYGAGTGTGRGWTTLAAGHHEMLRVEEVSGERIRVRGAGGGGGLIHAYPWREPSAAADPGASRWQLVRVPQYESLTLSGDLTALPWNGRSGGVLALDVRRTLSLAGHGLDAREAGFRGAAPLDLDGALGSENDYRYRAPDPRELAAGYGQHGGKGEGLAGSPRWLVQDNRVREPRQVPRGGSDGYPGGSMARGAPANAGGGGNSLSLDNLEVSGGGGGGGGRVGEEGRDVEGQPLGGRGGAAVAARASRVVFGGGGGAGSRARGRELASAGGAGGGVVYLRAGRIEGPGSIGAGGAPGRGGEHSGGGGGGGGTLVLLAPFGNLDAIELDLDGGAGGAAPAPGGSGGSGRLLAGGGMDWTALPSEPAVQGQLQPGQLPGVAPGYQCRPSGTLISGGIVGTRQPARAEPEGTGIAGRTVQVRNAAGEVLKETRTGPTGQYALELPDTLAGEALELEMDLPGGWHPVRAARGDASPATVEYLGQGRWSMEAMDEVHYEGLELVLMEQPEMEGPPPRSIAPGNTEIFLFRYLPRAEARVRFRYRAHQREADNWEHTFFLDPECDGASQYVDRELTRWVDAVADTPVCVRVRVRVPETMPEEILDMEVIAETDPGPTALEVSLPELRRRLEISVQSP